MPPPSEPLAEATDPTLAIALAMIALGGVRIGVAVANSEAVGGELGLAWALVVGGMRWLRSPHSARMR